MFADGLRYDFGQRLAARLRDTGMKVEASASYAATPTVTATAKPAQAPVKEELSGSDGGEFRPIVESSGKAVDHAGLKKLLAAAGVQFLSAPETGDTAGCAWTEAGRLDHTGHNDEERLCWRLEEEIEALTERIVDLLQAGWAEVVVTTDHGWMLVPGGLPKLELPSYLTATQWSRCAVVTPGSNLSAWEGVVAPWTWNKHVTIAMPSGCGAFFAGKAFAHGGISLQECVLPRLTVRSGSGGLVVVQIREPVWRGLRARVQVNGAPKGSQVTIRTKAADPATAITENAGVVDGKGESVSLLVSDYEYEGQGAFIVVTDASGTVLAKRLVTVGGEEE